MMSQLLLQNMDYSHREYKNDVDVPQDESRYTFEGQCKRTVMAALPFISLYQPIGTTLTLVMSSMRIFTNIKHLSDTEDSREKVIQGIQTFISIGSLASSIFAHPMGMIVTTGQDIVMECRNLCILSQDGNNHEILVSVGKIFNHTLYLAVLTKGGLEITFASLLMQIANGLYQSFDEISNGNYIEAFGKAGMSAMRGMQCKEQIIALQTKWKMDFSAWKISLKMQLVKNIKMILNTKSQEYLPKKEITEKNINEVLIMAIEANNAQAVQKILEKGPIDKIKDNALVSAINKGNKAVIKLMVDRTPFLKENSLKFLLHSITVGNREILDYFLELNPTFIESPKLFKPMLYCAIRTKKESIVDYLIKNGSDHQITIDDIKFTIINGNANIFKLLIHKNPMLEPSYFKEFLWVSINNKKADVVAILVKEKKFPQLTIDDIVLAIQITKWEKIPGPGNTKWKIDNSILKLIIQNSPKVVINSINNNKIIQIARSKCNIELVSYLIEKGPIDKVPVNILIYVIEQGRNISAKHLIDGNPSLLEGSFDQLLNIAKKNNNSEMFHILLEKKFGGNQLDIQNFLYSNVQKNKIIDNDIKSFPAYKLPTLHLAIKNKNNQLVKKLVEDSKTDLNEMSKPPFGHHEIPMSPIFQAIESNNLEAVKLLLNSKRCDIEKRLPDWVIDNSDFMGDIFDKHPFIGFSPLQLARRRKNDEIISLLSQAMLESFDI